MIFLQLIGGLVVAALIWLGICKYLEIAMFKPRTKTKQGRQN